MAEEPLQGPSTRWSACEYLLTLPKKSSCVGLGMEARMDNSAPLNQAQVRLYLKSGQPDISLPDDTGSILVNTSIQSKVKIITLEKLLTSPQTSADTPSLPY